MKDSEGGTDISGFTSTSYRLATASGLQSQDKAGDQQTPSPSGHRSFLEVALSSFQVCRELVSSESTAQIKHSRFSKGF